MFAFESHSDNALQSAGGNICHKAGTSQAIYFKERNYDGFLPTEIRRLNQLEDENGKLKRIVAIGQGDAAGRHLRALRPLSARLSTRSVLIGMSQSSGPVECLRSSGQLTTGDPDRPAWKPGSWRSAKPGIATATIAYTRCWEARVVEQPEKARRAIALDD